MEDKNKINSQNTYPWYDSVWLQKHKLAFKAISEKHPQKLKEFIHAFDGLKTRPDFKTVKYRSIFEENTLAAIREVIKSIRPAEIELHELKDFRRFIMHNHPDMTSTA